MAIIKELYKIRSDGVRLFRIYSDSGNKIRQIESDIIYDEAIDVEGAPYTYEETDQSIDIDSDTAIDIILGNI